MTIHRHFEVGKNRLDKLPHLGTPGTWGAWYGLGPKLPDFGITEALTGSWGQPQQTLLSNPLVSTVGANTPQGSYFSPPVSSGQVQGTSTEKPIQQTVTPQPQQQPQGYWDKDFGDPNHPDLSNPIKQDAFRRYQESLRIQRESSPEYKAEQLRKQQEEEAAISGIYSPLFASLDEQRRNVEAQQPGEEQRIQGAYARGIEGVTGQQSEAQMQLARRGTESERAQANALANARQLYSELSQRYGALFGSRSSAGPAAQELLGRETTRRFGEVGSAREQDRQAIADETARLTTWTNTQKNEWGRKKQEAVDTLKNVFRDKIAQINSQRGVLESQKAQNRAQALTDARTKQAMVEQADRDFQQRLALFQAEKQSQLAAAPQYAMTPWDSAVQGMGQYSGPQMGQTSGQATDNSFAPGKETYTWMIDPRTGERKITGYR